MSAEANVPYFWGYTCAVCGTWVPQGSFHACQMGNANITFHANHDAEIMAELRAIRELLEQLVTNKRSENA